MIRAAKQFCSNCIGLTQARVECSRVCFHKGSHAMVSITLGYLLLWASHRDAKIWNMTRVDLDPNLTIKRKREWEILAQKERVVH